MHGHRPDAASRDAARPWPSGGCIRAEANSQAQQRGTPCVAINLAWLLAHPAGVIPLVGSTNSAYIREAASATQVHVGREEWYRPWVAAWGRNVP